jgi:signal transduction histidine kinase
VFRTAVPQGVSRRLIAAFVLLLLLPAIAVVWLGVRLIIQDQQLEAERLRKQRESAAEQLVELLNRRLSSAEENLASEEPPGDGAVRLVIGAEGVDTRPATRLLYYPGLPVASGDEGPAFAAGEQLEHQRGDLGAAEAAFRRLTGDRSPSIRAGALVRLARVLRKSGRSEQALEIYDTLARLRGVAVDGLPADLVARRARCRVLDDLKQSARLREEAATLQSALLAGAWQLDRGTFDQYEAEVAAWLGSAVGSPSPQRALAEAVGWLWERRGTAGRRAVRFGEVDFALLWQSAGGRTHALVAGPEFQKREWFSAIETASARHDTQVALATASRPVFGVVPVASDTETLVRPFTQTGLPWDVTVGTRSDASIGSSRRLAILLGLGFLILLVVAGGYVIGRAVSRELAVARLQSDFVASVSHEFRTPLTSLRQFTDLLNEADDLTPDKRRGFYAAQLRATDRLQRLVESLLDFRRMEAGTHPYQRRRIAASPLVESVVDDFRRDAAARGFDVEFARSGDERRIDVDADAVSLALWNLLDNAVKYSGDNRRVSVSLAGRNGSVEIAVRDGGLGVPADEQQEIFRQFVRGRDARARGIKGTGLGLAMVQHIVRGHGGRVALASAPGAGSTFTIVLPAASESD